MWFFVEFPKLGGIFEISKIFLKVNEAFQLLRGGFFEIIDIPPRKRNLQNPNFANFRKGRVFSAVILS